MPVNTAIARAIAGAVCHDIVDIVDIVGTAVNVLASDVSQCASFMG